MLIFGLKLKEAENLSVQNGQDGEVVGRWLDSAGRITIFRKEGTFKVEWKDPNGYSRTRNLVEVSSPLGRCFNDPDTESDDYYLVEGGGNLQLRDTMGLIKIAERIE